MKDRVTTLIDRIAALGLEWEVQEPGGYIRTVKPCRCPLWALMEEDKGEPRDLLGEGLTGWTIRTQGLTNLEAWEVIASADNDSYYVRLQDDAPRGTWIYPDPDIRAYMLKKLVGGVADQ